MITGPIRDFNLIYAPQRFAARLQWCAADSRVYSSAQTLLVFAADERVQVALAGQSEQVLGRYDCLRLDGNQGLVEMRISGQVCLIELTER